MSAPNSLDWAEFDAPIVSLAGAHGGEILSCCFDPTGQNITACSADCSISLWRTYGPNTNYGLLASLTKVLILDLQWSLVSPSLYAVSADRMLLALDTTMGQRGPASSSDDGSMRVWDPLNSKHLLSTFTLGVPVMGVAWSADSAVGLPHVLFQQHTPRRCDFDFSTPDVVPGFTTAHGNYLDHNEVDDCTDPTGKLCLTSSSYKLYLTHSLTINPPEEEQVIFGTLFSKQTPHSPSQRDDTPTLLALSPNGEYLLSLSLSSQTLVHDVHPFSPAPSRMHRTLLGTPASFEGTLLRGAPAHVLVLLIVDVRPPLTHYSEHEQAAAPTYSTLPPHAASWNSASLNLDTLVESCAMQMPLVPPTAHPGPALLFPSENLATFDANSHSRTLRYGQSPSSIDAESTFAYPDSDHLVHADSPYFSTMDSQSCFDLPQSSIFYTDFVSSLCEWLCSTS
ncbi:hypothetical protein C8J57DRAFT_1517322 [Mycena rebaudengoi]|nr:hypothetical protein C8J57DRAFT_1517322 [Mycena rebaudengoi]